ncbi:MAG: YggS family pyridoxal phosphate-dependent enzyme [archaeon]
MSIKENTKRILSGIPESVKVVAATKKQPAEKIKQAVEAGIKIIGENTVQEAEKKFTELDFPVEKHFIGHLQSNKAKKAVELFDCIQSVDSVKLAGKIDSSCISLAKTMPVFIELNSGEKQKTGIEKEKINELAEKINEFSSLKLKGLMFMAPFFGEPEKSEPYFIETRNVFFELKKSFPLMEFLSMGMTDDYLIAVRNGSNMVRIGRKIFE